MEYDSCMPILYLKAGQLPLLSVHRSGRHHRPRKAVSKPYREVVFDKAVFTRAMQLCPALRGKLPTNKADFDAMTKLHLSGQDATQHACTLMDVVVQNINMGGIHYR